MFDLSLNLFQMNHGELELRKHFFIDNSVGVERFDGFIDILLVGDLKESVFVLGAGFYAEEDGTIRVNVREPPVGRLLYEARAE